MDEVGTFVEGMADALVVTAAAGVMGGRADGTMAVGGRIGARLGRMRLISATNGTGLLAAVMVAIM